MVPGVGGGWVGLGGWVSEGHKSNKWGASEAGMMEVKGSERGRVEGTDFGERNLKLQKGSLPRKSERNSIES